LPTLREDVLTGLGAKASYPPVGSHLFSTQPEQDTQPQNHTLQRTDSHGSLARTAEQASNPLTQANISHRLLK